MAVDLGGDQMLKVRITYVGDDAGRAEAQEFVDHIYKEFECFSSSREYGLRNNSKYVSKYFEFENVGTRDNSR